MMKIDFSVTTASVNAELAKKIQQLRSEIETLTEKLVQEFRQSERFKAACDLCGVGDYGGKMTPHTSISGPYINVSIWTNATEGHAPEKKACVNLHESTLNVLLSGKLLSDDEKRNLIAALTSGVLEQSEGGAA